MKLLTSTPKNNLNIKISLSLKQLPGENLLIHTIHLMPLTNSSGAELTTYEAIAPVPQSP